MSAASGSPSHEAPDPSTSTREPSARSPAAKSEPLASPPTPAQRKSGAAQWTVDKSAPPNSSGGDDSKRPPPMDDYSDQSSNDSDEDSDELDDAGDEHDRDRELSDGARGGDPEDLTDKELCVLFLFPALRVALMRQGVCLRGHPTTTTCKGLWVWRQGKWAVGKTCIDRLGD